MMDVQAFYCGNTPAFIAELCETPPMRRLRDVGMNCGCEYTSFPLYDGLLPYSRFDHSLGCARIVWRFTGDPAQAVAALFHDIATPAFAHVIDFLHKDYLAQESTEAGTGRIIRESGEIMALLDRYGLRAGDVDDYHRYPIADNDSPRLSADRLEYTLGNLENYGYRDVATLRAYYEDLVVSVGEDGAPELAFRDGDTARAFALDALRCSRVYVSDEDRYAMQMLAELVGEAIAAGVLSEADLYRTEGEVIAALEGDPHSRASWRRFRAYHAMISDGPEEARRIVPAKRRYIDPLVDGKGRASRLFPDFRRELDAFLALPQDVPICAI